MRQIRARTIVPKPDLKFPASIYNTDLNRRIIIYNTDLYRIGNIDHQNLKRFKEPDPIDDSELQTVVFFGKIYNPEGKTVIMIAFASLLPAFWTALAFSTASV